MFQNYLLEIGIDRLHTLLWLPLLLTPHPPLSQHPLRLLLKIRQFIRSALSYNAMKIKTSLSYHISALFFVVDNYEVFLFG